MSRLLVALLLLVACVGAQAESTLHPGQRLRLVCVLDPRLDVIRTIAADGYVNLPVVGKVGAAGQTLDRLTDSVNGRMLAFGSVATVDVYLTRNPHGEIAFGGAISYPGAAPFRSGLTLSALLAIVAPTESADIHSVHVTDGTGKDLVCDAASAGSLVLRPGDTVTVPPGVGSDQVTVLGGVMTAGAAPFHDGLTVADAIAASGGLSKHGDTSHMLVQRKGEDVPATLQTVLMRGDVVRVGVIVDLKYVSVKGAIANPGVVEWHQGMRLSEVISAAGGATDRAALTRIELHPFGTKQRLRFDLLAIRNAAKPDPEIQPNDTVVVPSTRGRR
jgi:protein involved in polysaccharide export with SLBB domain